MGGKHRYLIGGADVFVEDEAMAFREAAIEALSIKRGWSAKTLETEQKRLERRLQRFGDTEDAVEIWQALGVEHPTEIPALPTDAFLRAASNRENADDAR
jgi:malonate decarboxylase beta subunit